MMTEREKLLDKRAKAVLEIGGIDAQIRVINIGVGINESDLAPRPQEQKSEEKEKSD